MGTHAVERANVSGCWDGTRSCERKLILPQWALGAALWWDLAWGGRSTEEPARPPDAHSGFQGKPLACRMVPLLQGTGVDTGPARPHCWVPEVARALRAPWGRCVALQGQGSRPSWVGATGYGMEPAGA